MWLKCPHNSLQIIKDWLLVLGVLILVVFDLIILVVYTITEGFRGNLSAQNVPNRENYEDVTGVSEISTILSLELHSMILYYTVKPFT